MGILGKREEQGRKNLLMRHWQIEGGTETARKGSSTE